MVILSEIWAFDFQERLALTACDSEVPNHDQPKVNGKKRLLEKLGIGKKKQEENSDVAAKYTLLDVLKNRKLITYAIIMCLLW